MNQEKNIQYPPALPHEAIEKFFDNIYLVIGTSITLHESTAIQHSSNMTIVRNGEELTLINTVRLNENELQQLDALGKVKNVIRLGAFHGQDDAFYLDRYHARLWALPGMKTDCGQGENINADVILSADGEIPFPGCSIFVFETSSCPEAILHVAQQGGILITCDSVKNWTTIDRFFSQETANQHLQAGEIVPANIAFWSKACNVQIVDFSRLMQFSFCHLIGAHGKPIINHADAMLLKSIKKLYGKVKGIQ